MLKVYADTNIYARQFDDRSQTRINLEAVACSMIFDYIRTNKVTLIGSAILRYEIQNTRASKLPYVLPLFNFCQLIIKYDSKIYSIAHELLNNINLKAQDAVHIASALKGGVDYFITCDNQILKKANEISVFLTKRSKAKNYSTGFSIINPVELIIILTYASKS